MPKCYLVNPRGFCTGVSRAYNMAEQALKLYGSIYITEDIVHNKHVMQELSDKGLIRVDSLEDVPDNSVLMVSAHGVSPSYIEDAEERGMTVIDATCPVVNKLQKKVEESSKDGKKIIIIGSPSHAEIVGLRGAAHDETDVYIVSNMSDVERLPEFKESDEIVYYTQTTLDMQFVDDVVALLRKRFPQIEAPEYGNNLCHATKSRQKALLAIAEKVPLVLVIGSAHSSNANRLVDVARRAGATSYRIDSDHDLNMEWFEDGNDFAITTGASAPELILQHVMAYLEDRIKGLEFEEFSIENNIEKDIKGE